MLDKYFESAFRLERLRHGPSGPFLDGFAGSLYGDGYSWLTARAYLRAAHHLGHFLQREDIALVALQPDTISVFRRHLKDCRCPKPRGSKTEDTVRGAKRYLRYLWNVGTVPRPTKQPWPPLVQGFRDWLRIHRGSSETNIRRALEIALVPPTPRRRARSKRKARMRPASYWPGSSPSSPRNSTAAAPYRARVFCAIWLPRGSVEQAWTSPSRRSQDGVWPHYRAVCRQMRSSNYLSACEPSSSMGLRDRAVILLLARLGLRASDVAALRFADIDWEDGSILCKRQKPSRSTASSSARGWRRDNHLSRAPASRSG